MSEEREAIWRLQQGDIGGLDYLVRHYQVRAVRAAYLVTHDAALAEDVVQAAFVKAYERISQFDPTRPFGPWFLTSVLHDAVKFAQERARHTSIESMEEDPRSSGESVLEDERPGPETLWEQAETAEEVRAALLRLVPEQRRAVVARYYLGLSEAETAAAQSAPLSTIKWRLHDARRRLRLILTPTLLK
jgi:RNA polymerase sigma-70 factor (ECF subfamily)